MDFDKRNAKRFCQMSNTVGVVSFYEKDFNTGLICGSMIQMSGIFRQLLIRKKVLERMHVFE